MAQTSWPFENIDTTETQFSQWAKNINEGVKQGNGDELVVSADGTGMTVSVGSGQSMIRGHYYSSTATESLAITASDPTNPRIDAVVLELDPTANTILLKVLAGTPAGSPVAPTLTQTEAGVYQLPLAYIAVAATVLAIESGDVTDKRGFMFSGIGKWTTDNRPTNPIQYETTGYNTTLNTHEFWNGTSWVGFADPITTEGDLIVGGASGAPERLPVGADDQVLTVVAGVPEWADAAGGGGGSVTGSSPGQSVYATGTSKDVYDFTAVGNGEEIGFYANNAFVKHPTTGKHYAPVYPLNSYSLSYPNRYTTTPNFSDGLTYQIAGSRLLSNYNNGYGAWANVTSTSAPDGGALSSMIGFDPGINRIWANYYDPAGLYLAYSDDNGLTWVQSAPALQNNPSNHVVGDSSVSNLVVYRSANGTTEYYTSSNGGASWTTRTLPSGDTWSSIIWDGTKFVGSSYTYSGYTRYVLTSTDGISWTTRLSFTDGDSYMREHNLVWNGLTGADSKFLLNVQMNYTADFLGIQCWSLDGGITWTRDYRISPYINRVAGGNGYFVASYGINNTLATTQVFYTQDPSLGWSQADITEGEGISQLAYGKQNITPNYSNGYFTYNIVPFGNGFVIEQQGRAFIDGGDVTTYAYYYTTDFINFEIVNMGGTNETLYDNYYFSQPFVDNNGVFYNRSYAAPNGEFPHPYTSWVMFTNSPEFEILN